jgi:hypothetical protein
MNILCTDVLIAGSQQEKQPIPASIVRRVIAEFEPTRPSRLPRLTWLRAACVLLLVGVGGALLYSKLSYVSPAASVSPAVSEPPQAVMQVSPPARPVDRSEPSSYSNEVAATPPAASTPPAAPVEMPQERPQPVAPSVASEPLAPPALPPALAVDDRLATSPLPALTSPPAPPAETSASPSSDLTAASEVMNQVEALMQRLFPDGGDFQLQVWGNKKAERVYVEGEKLLVHILANTDAYLQVDYYQADGQVVHLLPHALADNRVQAGQIFTLGKAEHLFQFNIAPPFGEEMLVVIASQQPLALPTGMSSNVELASLYTERLAHQLQTYQAQGQIAVASWRIRTQKSHGTRLSQTTSP